MNESAWAQAASTGKTPSPETLQMRLKHIYEVLVDCESLLYQVDDKVHGVGPEGDSKVAGEPRGVNAWTIEINNCAQRIRVNLEKLSLFLG